jgi:hypothetical protein
VQLKIGKEYKFLDLSTIGKSMEIVEVASVVLIGRRMYDDEIDGRNKLYVFDYKINNFTKKYEIQNIQLDKDKNYLILFIAKNRGGTTDVQIVYEIDYATNQWIELGFVKVPRTSNAL